MNTTYIVITIITSIIALYFLYKRGFGDRTQRNWDKIQEELEKAKVFGDADGMAKCYYKLGLLAHKKKQLNTAESFYRQCLDITRKLGYEQGIASLLYQLGWMSMERNNIDQAIAQFEEALVVFKNGKYPEEKAAEAALQQAKKRKEKKNTAVRKR